MSLARYACCNQSIGDPHASGCGGSDRYPLGRERETADRYAREIGDSIDRDRLRTKD